MVARIVVDWRGDRVRASPSASRDVLRERLVHDAKQLRLGAVAHDPADLLASREEEGVGTDIPPKRSTTLGLASESTVTTRRLPSRSLAISASTGAIARQGGHQDAPSSTGTGVVAATTSTAKVASLTASIMRRSPRRAGGDGLVGGAAGVRPRRRGIDLLGAEPLPDRLAGPESGDRHPAP